MKGRIIQEGMGGFLCPPGHPAHSRHVETDLRRKPENRSTMSLEYAIDDTTLDGTTWAEVNAILKHWEANKLPLDSARVQEWIFQVLGYFKDCYNLTPDVETGWHAGNVTISKRIDPMELADYHAGVHCIRRYYSDYKPTAEDFAGAYWGKKP